MPSDTGSIKHISSRELTWKLLSNITERSGLQQWTWSCLQRALKPLTSHLDHPLCECHLDQAVLPVDHHGVKARKPVRRHLLRVLVSQANNHSLGVVAAIEKRLYWLGYPKTCWLWWSVGKLCCLKQLEMADDLHRCDPPLGLLNAVLQTVVIPSFARKVVSDVVVRWLGLVRKVGGRQVSHAQSSTVIGFGRRG